jgi:hypothetical protein
LIGKVSRDIRLVPASRVAIVEFPRVLAEEIDELRRIVHNSDICSAVQMNVGGSDSLVWYEY